MDTASSVLFGRGTDQSVAGSPPYFSSFHHGLRVFERVSRIYEATIQKLCEESGDEERDTRMKGKSDTTFGLVTSLHEAELEAESTPSSQSWSLKYLKDDQDLGPM